MGGPPPRASLRSGASLPRKRERGGTCCSLTARPTGSGMGKVEVGRRVVEANTHIYKVGTRPNPSLPLAWGAPARLIDDLRRRRCPTPLPLAGEGRGDSRGEGAPCHAPSGQQDLALCPQPAPHIRYLGASRRVKQFLCGSPPPPRPDRGPAHERRRASRGVEVLRRGVGQGSGRISRVAESARLPKRWRSRVRALMVAGSAPWKTAARSRVMRTVAPPWAVSSARAWASSP